MGTPLLSMHDPCKSANAVSLCMAAFIQGLSCVSKFVVAMPQGPTNMMLAAIYKGFDAAA